MFNDIPVKYREEFRHYLEGKKEKLQAELDDVGKLLSDLNHLDRSPSNYIQTNPLDQDSIIRNPRNSIGWKFKIRDVLEAISPAPLTSTQIVEELKRREPDIDASVAIKSVGSALSTNSKDAKSMFIKEVKNGIHYYTNNELYVE